MNAIIEKEKEKPKNAGGASANAGPAASPAQQTHAPVVVTDSDGRHIVLKKPDVLASYHLVEALGDAARNTTYIGMVTPLLLVHSIDGAAVERFRSKDDIEALITKLGESGMQAVMGGMLQHFISPEMAEALRSNVGAA